jgi:hypothetical protein
MASTTKPLVLGAGVGARAPARNMPAAAIPAAASQYVTHRCLASIHPQRLLMTRASSHCPGATPVCVTSTTRERRRHRRPSDRRHLAGHVAQARRRGAAGAARRERGCTGGHPPHVGRSTCWRAGARRRPIQPDASTALLLACRRWVHIRIVERGGSHPTADRNQRNRIPAVCAELSGAWRAVQGARDGATQQSTELLRREHSAVRRQRAPRRPSCAPLYEGVRERGASLAPSPVAAQACQPGSDGGRIKYMCTVVE